MNGGRRIVVSTSSTLAERMAGPAIRAWHMAQALSAHHEVKLVTPAACEVSHPAFECRGDVGPADWVDLEAWCDVIVLQGFLLEAVGWLGQSAKPMVVDLYDPFHLEQLEMSRELPMDERIRQVAWNVQVLNDQIRRGDAFLCASERQRDFWLGQMAAMQRVNPVTYERDETLRDLLAVVPFGVPDDPPVRTGPGVRGAVAGIGEHDPLLVWGGGIYNWFDPATLIRAVDLLRRRIPDVRLYFMGGAHPDPFVPEMRAATEARRLSAELGLEGVNVFFNDGWVPYDRRQDFLLDADVGVSTHLDHVETELSFRTRVLDYLWVGAPVVCTAGDTLADMVEGRGLGSTAAPGDVEGLAEALHGLLSSPEALARCRRKVEAEAEALRWSRVLEPLLEICAGVERSPDAGVLAPPLRVPVPGAREAVRTALARRWRSLTSRSRKGPQPT